MHLIIDIPGDTELVEPLEESCVWRHVRGAALDVSRMDSTVTTVEKVYVSVPLSEKKLATIISSFCFVYVLSSVT